MRIDHYAELKKGHEFPLSPKSKKFLLDNLDSGTNNLSGNKHVRQSRSILQGLDADSLERPEQENDTSNLANLSQENSFIEFNSLSANVLSPGGQSLATSQFYRTQQGRPMDESTISMAHRDISKLRVTNYFWNPRYMRTGVSSFPFNQANDFEKDNFL